MKFRFALGDPSLRPEEQAEVLLWLGVTYGQLSKNDAARSPFRDAFLLAPEATLPAITPPTLSPLAEQAREALAARAKAAPDRAPPAPESAPAADGGSAVEQDAPEAGLEPANDGGLALLTLSGALAAGVGPVTIVAAAAWAANSYLVATNSASFQGDADAAVLQMNIAGRGRRARGGGGRARGRWSSAGSVRPAGGVRDRVGQ